MRRSFRLLASLAIASAALLCVSGRSASAYTFKTIFTFCYENCKHGTALGPNGGVIGDPAGNLYGVAGDNAVYEISPDAKGKWRYKALHNFTNGKDGGGPYGVLIMDTAGDIYGTTSSGGVGGGGTVFELVPNELHTKWHLTTLYHFCAKLNCADGNSPRVGLTYAGALTGALYDGSSPLFGTTVGGGAAESCGVVFQLKASNGRWSEKVIHTFDGSITLNDGCNPNSVFVDGDGNIVGTTQLGSTESDISGSVFKLVPNEAHTKWTEHVLKNFLCTGENNDVCTDGASPWGNVTEVGSDLYGTTITGGTGSGAPCEPVINGGNSCGVAFKIASDGAYSKIYDFCSLENCVDAISPRTTLLADGAGDLFGVTQDSGPNIQYPGTVFEIDSEGHEQVLHGFTGGADGRLPNQDLFRDAAGNIFGTAAAGGGSGKAGTVFELTP